MAEHKKKIAILGSTGSIGTQALEVLDLIPDMFEIIALSAGSNIDLISNQINKYKPELVCVKTQKDAEKLKEKHGNVKFVFGDNGLIEIANIEKIEMILVAVSGKIGLKPTVQAIKNKKDIASHNKSFFIC